MIICPPEHSHARPCCWHPPCWQTLACRIIGSTAPAQRETLPGSMAAKAHFRKALLYALAALLVLGALAAVSHDAVFRWLALQAMQRVPDLDAQIDGRFDVTHAIPLTLDASEVRLAISGGEFEGTHARLQDLHLEIDLWQLLQGVVHIEQLMITGADIDILPSRVTTTRPPATHLRIPFVKELRLERVHVRFQHEPDTKPHELSIAHVEIGVGKDGDLEADGTATLDGHALALDATFGSVEQFVRPTAPFPVDATLRVPDWDLKVRVSGTLAEPLHGGGAELDFRAATSNASPLRDVFFPGVPFAGAVDAGAKVSGDLHAPVLSNVTLTLDDGERLHLSIDGNVDDLKNLEGMDLKVEIASHDSTVTRYLLRDLRAPVDTLRTHSALRGSASDLHVEDLELEISAAGDSSLGARGTIHLGDLDSEWSIQAAQLDLRVTARIADLDAWWPEAAGKAGTFRGKTRVEVSDRSWAFDSLELELDKTEPLRGFVRGKLAYTSAQIEAIRATDRSSAKPWIPADLDLSLDLETRDSKSLGILLRQDFPDLGPVSAKARITRDGKGIQVTRLDATTAGKRPLSIATKGRLAFGGTDSTQQLRDIHLELEAKGENAESVVPFVGSLPIDPGPWSLEARLTGKPQKIRVEALKILSAPGDSVQIALDGTIRDLNRVLASAGKSFDGVNLNGQVRAASTDKLGPLIDQPVPNLGRVDARFEVRGEKDDWTVSKAMLSLFNDSGFEIQATGHVSRLLNDPRFGAHLNAHIPDPKRALDAGNSSIPRIAAISVDGQLEGTRKHGSFVGRIDIGSTPLDTDIEVDWTRSRPYLSGKLTTPVLTLDDFVNPASWSRGPSSNAARSGTASSAQGEELGPPRKSTQQLSDLLRHADVDLELVVDEIEGKQFRAEHLELAVKVDNGRLEIHHKKLKHENGAVTMSLEVDNTVEPPEVTFKGQGDNISLGALHAQISDDPDLLKGEFSFDIDMEGQGLSYDRILATSNGYWGLILEKAELTGRDLDVLAFDFLQALTTAAGPKGHTTIDCAIAKFKLDDGMAHSEILYVQTPKMFATSTGKVNFKTNMLDFLVRTDAKGRLFSKRATSRIHGPIHDPLVDTKVPPQAVASAITSAGAATVLAVPKLGFSILGLPFLDDLIRNDQGGPCTTVVASIRETADSKLR